MMPQAGGPYAYVLKTFGPLPGFLIMWGYVVLIAGPFWAFLAYTAALYIVKPVFPDCQPKEVETAVKLLAGWIMSESTESWRSFSLTCRVLYAWTDRPCSQSLWFLSLRHHFRQAG